MSSTENVALDHTEELTAEFREFLLSRKVWTQALRRLDGERKRLLQVVDVAKPKPQSSVWIRLMQIEHETAMYEICLDRAHERAELIEGIETPQVSERRERFYRLMRGLAKAGNERAEMGGWEPTIGVTEGHEGWTPDRWVAGMQTVASEARKLLVATILL